MELAKADQDAEVGIETLDDVVLRDAATRGSIVSEQDKYTIRARHLLGDTTVDLWKTLALWSDRLSEAPAPDVIALRLVTNAAVNEGLLTKIAAATTEAEVRDAVRTLRGIAASLPVTTKRYGDRVVAHSDVALIKMVKLVSLSSGNQSGTGRGLTLAVSNALSIPPSYPQADLVAGLLGWIQLTAFEKWTAGEPVWISKVALMNQLQRLLTRQRSELVVRSAATIPISDSKVNKHSDRVFVHQIRLLEMREEEDTILEAVYDFLRYKDERMRLLEQGEVTEVDLKEFTDGLKRFWRLRQQLHSSTLERTRRSYRDESRKAGIAVYGDAMVHRGTLGESEVGGYLTIGGFHSLADSKTIGWHPDFRELLANKE